MRFFTIILFVTIFFSAVQTPAAEKRTGRVRASGRALADDQGEFHALGATVMWALWAYKNDRAWLDRNLQFLSERGFHYIRALGVIDRKIETNPNAYWYRLHMAMNWPNYDEMIAGMTEHVYNKFGMRVEWTIFGGACDFDEGQKKQLLDKFINMSKGREHMIMHFEVANELHGTCWSGDQGSANLRDWTKYLNDRTDILVAGSSPYGTDPCAEMTKIYHGGVADIGTQHFDRDTSKGDGFWRPARQSWEYPYCPAVPAIGSNNEPIGPGASVVSDMDPWTNVANAIVSRISGLPLHVYHGEMGVRADWGDYTNYATDVTDSFAAMNRYLPGDITNWTRENHHWAGHPFITNGEIGYPPERGSGAVRNYGAHNGNDFITFPMGVKDYLSLTAKHNMKFCVIHPLTGQLLDRVSLNAGQSYSVRGYPALVLRGKINSSDDGCSDYTAKPKAAGRLKRDGELKPGESLKSGNGKHELIYQDDNNLVIYSEGRAIWASNTAGKPNPGAVIMQGDGNLVIYNQQGQPLWSSGTAGNDDAYLLLNDEGELSLYNKDDGILKDLFVPPTKMTAGQSLKPSEVIKVRDYELTYQGDNNLVLYKNGTALWSSGTADNNPGSVQMQGDGNLVIYNGNGRPVWSSGTAEYEGGFLGVHTDGRLVMYNQDGGQVKVLFGGK